MKPKTEPVVPEAMLQAARVAAEPDRFQKPKKCTVCSEEYSTGAQDGLCWVCRRLKLSAWKDADSQMPASD